MLSSLITIFLRVQHIYTNFVDDPLIQSISMVKKLILKWLLNSLYMYKTEWSIVWQILKDDLNSLIKY